MRASGATAWHDALFAGLKVVETASHRPAVTLFSDGVDTYSFLLEEQLLPLVEQSHAVLYAVTPAPKRPPPGTEFSSNRKEWHAFREQREQSTFV